MDDRLTRARTSLEGLAVGDAFGEKFFISWEMVKDLLAKANRPGPPYDFTDNLIRDYINERHVPEPPWRYTDDTQMALSIFSILRRRGTVDQDALARDFGEHYDSMRGYGAAMHDLLPRYRRGETWQKGARLLFNGQGSCGNGGAMRAAPVGAYFADDLKLVVENARKAAEVTHAHPEGVAGAVAVAVAAAHAARAHDGKPLMGADFLNLVLSSVPPGEVRRGIEQAVELCDVRDVEAAANILGTGEDVMAQDTVPFCLWCAAQELDHYDEALWLTVSGLGDRDTTCAIVGGIVSCYTGTEAIPSAWLVAREDLPAWALEG